MLRSSGESAELVLLGTAGGPRPQPERAGIASALRVGEALYLVDLGYGACRQLTLAGFGFERLRAGFVTHLHSDHIADLGNLLLYGWYAGLCEVPRPVRLFGPGPRPPYRDPGAAGLPGFTETLRRLLHAYATDIEDRIIDNARRPPEEVLDGTDIPLPDSLGFDPRTRVAPDMEPLAVYRDEHVEVSAILVQHAPMAPAFAFRFDTAHGSVVFSGDTGPCANLVRLAHGADVLVHEVIDEHWIQRSYSGANDPVAAAMFAHHTTAHTSIPDAGRIAAECGARTLVLTHFVPGHNPAPRWHEAADTFGGRLVVGADLDRIPLR